MTIFLPTYSLSAHPHGPQLLAIMRAALEAVDPARAVARALRLRDGRVELGTAHEARAYAPRRVVVLSAGKAGAPMAQAALNLLGPLVDQGLVVVKQGHLGPAWPAGPLELYEAGHPIPDARGVAAARRICALASGLEQDDLLLLLLSGGGSALLTLPAGELSLADLQAMTEALLRCGATIGELNCLRKHTTQLFGGQLARLAQPAQVAALILSDVVGSPLDVIASGPCAPDPSSYADALGVLRRYALEATLPPALLGHLEQGAQGLLPETPKPGEPLWGRVSNHVVASNRHAAEAAEAAARALGFQTLLLTTSLEGEAREAGRQAAALAHALARLLPASRPPCLVIAAGETTVKVRGPGLGGRNQELALSAVEMLAGLPDALLVALASDGGDGPTDAAGAVVSGETFARARALGLDPASYLARNDSYHFFQPLDDLLLSGPTLTNVNDLLLIVV